MSSGEGAGTGLEKGVRERDPPNLELHRLLHGAQMHRNVGGIGDQPPIGSEEGAGEVQPLLDVGGDGRALQDAAHLLWGHRVTRRPLASPHPEHDPRYGEAGPSASKASKAQSQDLEMAVAHLGTVRPLPGHVLPV